MKKQELKTLIKEVYSELNEGNGIKLGQIPLDIRKILQKMRAVDKINLTDSFINNNETGNMIGLVIKANVILNKSSLTDLIKNNSFSSLSVYDGGNYILYFQISKE